jgi:hypothetical protein
MDTNKPAMGYFYEAMYQAKEAIKETHVEKRQVSIKVGFPSQ